MIFLHEVVWHLWHILTWIRSKFQRKKTAYMTAILTRSQKKSTNWLLVVWFLDNWSNWQPQQLEYISGLFQLVFFNGDWQKCKCIQMYNKAPFHFCTRDKLNRYLYCTQYIWLNRFLYENSISFKFQEGDCSSST